MLQVRSRVEQAGHAVKPTTAACLTGLSVMAPTTVVTTPTRSWRNALRAIPPATLSVLTRGVYPSAGDVILTTTVRITRMRIQLCAVSDYKKIFLDD